MNLEAMAASIAHEVRQPLAAIALDGETALLFLERTPTDLGGAEAAVKSMVDASRRVGQIFDNIRSLFGKAELKKERLDMNSLILEVLRALESDIKAHGIETHIELTAKIHPVMGHRGQLQEVIINLIHNAVDAMDSVDGHRALKVRTEPSAGDAIAVAVEDTGPGFGSKDANTIFEAFVTTKTHGMGLGLAICRMIVERHEGRLSASSAYPRGAIFQIILPQATLPH
jgi:C4-dicarboxylate-specific signal transduction histidine kinase